MAGCGRKGRQHKLIDWHQSLSNSSCGNNSSLAPPSMEWINYTFIKLMHNFNIKNWGHCVKVLQWKHHISYKTLTEIVHNKQLELFNLLLLHIIFIFVILLLTVNESSSSLCFLSHCGLMNPDLSRLMVSIAHPQDQGHIGMQAYFGVMGETRASEGNPLSQGHNM